jgi:hypothetical protein
MVLRENEAKSVAKWRTVMRYVCHWIIAWYELVSSLLRVVTFGFFPPIASMWEFKITTGLYHLLGANIVWGGMTVLDTQLEMIDHLLQHRAEGDQVPDCAFRRLADEAQDWSKFPGEDPDSIVWRKKQAKKLSATYYETMRLMRHHNICVECFSVKPYWSDTCHNCKGDENDAG